MQPTMSTDADVHTVSTSAQEQLDTMKHVAQANAERYAAWRTQSEEECAARDARKANILSLLAAGAISATESEEMCRRLDREIEFHEEEATKQQQFEAERSSVLAHKISYVRKGLESFLLPFASSPLALRMLSSQTEEETQLVCIARALLTATHDVSKQLLMTQPELLVGFVETGTVVTLLEEATMVTNASAPRESPRPTASDSASDPSCKRVHVRSSCEQKLEGWVSLVATDGTSLFKPVKAVKSGFDLRTVSGTEERDIIGTHSTEVTPRYAKTLHVSVGGSIEVYSKTYKSWVKAVVVRVGDTDGDCSIAIVRYTNRVKKVDLGDRRVVRLPMSSGLMLRCKSKAAVTMGPEIDKPVVVGHIMAGEVMELLEINQTSKGRRRARIESGWVSLVAANGTKLFELCGTQECSTPRTPRTVSLPLDRPAQSAQLRIFVADPDAAAGEPMSLELEVMVTIAEFGARTCALGTASDSPRLLAAVPIRAEAPLSNASELRGSVAVISRGLVPWIQKAGRAQECGCAAVVFVNDDDRKYVPSEPGDGEGKITLPIVCARFSDGQRIEALLQRKDVRVHITLAYDCRATIVSFQSRPTSSRSIPTISVPTVSAPEPEDQAPPPPSPAPRGSARPTGLTVEVEDDDDPAVQMMRLREAIETLGSPGARSDRSAAEPAHGDSTSRTGSAADGWGLDEQLLTEEEQNAIKLRTCQSADQSGVRQWEDLQARFNAITDEFEETFLGPGEEDDSLDGDSFSIASSATGEHTRQQEKELNKLESENATLRARIESRTVEETSLQTEVDTLRRKLAQEEERRHEEEQRRLAAEEDALAAGSPRKEWQADVAWATSQILKLKDLLDMGVLSAEEFKQAKNKILWDKPGRTTSEREDAVIVDSSAAGGAVLFDL